jgi:hypothetical protein
MGSVYDFTDATYKVQFYGSLSMCIFGTITNLASIQVSQTKEMRNTSMGFYNILISIFNLLTIYFNLSMFFPQSIGHSQIINTSSLACILMPYFFRIFLQMSQWLNVMLSFGRVFLLLENARSDIRPLNIKRVLMIAFGLFIILCALNSFGFFYHLETQVKFDPITKEYVTEIICTSTYALHRDLIHAIIRAFIPMILQTVLNFILVFRLQDTENVITSTTPLPIKTELRFAKTIIVFNLLNIITDIIALGIHISINIYGYNQTYISMTSNESAISSFAFVCGFQFVIFIVCDLTFIVNVFSNKKFRNVAYCLYGMKKIGSNRIRSI